MIEITQHTDSQSTDNDFAFNETKQKIFDSAIELFSMNGYESVSIRDIANFIGTASLYYHFSSKQEILDTIYNYYRKNYYNKRVPVDQMKELLKNGTKEEFCSALMFTFETDDVVKIKRMALITKIVYMRIYQDETARDIFLGIMNADIEAYVNEILEYGVSIGRLKEFDIPTYSKFLIGQRHYMGMKAIADPNYKPNNLEEEKSIMKMSADMLPFIEK